MQLELSGRVEEGVAGAIIRCHFTQGISGQYMKLRFHSKCNVKPLEDVIKRRREAILEDKLDFCVE